MGDDTSRRMAETLRRLKATLADTKAALLDAEVKLAEWTAAGDHESIAAMQAEISTIREACRELREPFKILRGLAEGDSNPTAQTDP